MPDITMCYGTDCPLREECYRYKATPNPHRQSFAQFKLKIRYVDTIGYIPECDHFLPMQEKT